MAKKYTKNTPFSVFITDIISKNACAEGIDWTLLSKHVNSTFGEAMDDFLKDNLADEAWVRWCFEFYYDSWDDELRLECLKKIKNEMVAFKIYLDFEKLTDKEEKILKNKFEGKLPVAEKQLKDGKIKIKRKVKDIE